MKIRSTRLYSHPVLSSMYDDYQNSKFEIKVKAYKKTKKISLMISCTLENEEIINLINNGYAKIVCHFECSKTKLRCIADLTIGENNFTIDNSYLNESLEIIAFVVATTNIDNYYSQDFNLDYGNSKFYLETGSVIAISNQPDIPIIKDIYDLSKVSSIISIVPYNNENDHKILIDIDNDKIMVKLQKNEYKKYSELGKGISNFTPILHSAIIIPALTYTFDMLKSDEETFYSYENKRWFKAIEKKFEKMNKKFNFEELKNQDSFLLSQEILETPIVDTLSNLLSFGGN